MRKEREEMRETTLKKLETMKKETVSTLKTSEIWMQPVLHSLRLLGRDLDFGNREYAFD